jgi:hypothetical protein
MLVFALFNDDLKLEPTFERNYTLFYPKGTSEYRLKLRGGIVWYVASHQ